MFSSTPILNKNGKTDNTLQQYATFRLDDDFFAIEVSWVQEILKSQEMTPVPLAPDYISGLINLRGQIVTAINLKTRLRGEPVEISEDSMNLVVKAGDEVVSLLVDEIGDVLELDDRNMHPVPPTLQSMKTDYLNGVCKLEGRLLLIIDVERVLSTN